MLWAHTCNPSYSGGRVREDHGSKPIRKNSSGDPILTKTQKRAGGVDQAVECVPNKCETLNSNPSTAKIKQQKSHVCQLNSTIYSNMHVDTIIYAQACVCLILLGSQMF
jgi:hypothetical protein